MCADTIDQIVFRFRVAAFTIILPETFEAVTSLIAALFVFHMTA
jgi:hypothetical protein